MNVVGVVPVLSYSITSLMSNPIARYKPSKEALFNRRLRGLEPLLPVHIPPYEPAVEGLLSLFLALWELKSLTFPSLVFINVFNSSIVASVLLVLVYFIQPEKRAHLEGYILTIGFSVLVGVLALIYRAVSFFRAADSTQIAVVWALRQQLPPALSHVPWFVQFQIILTIVAGMYLTFRRTDSPQLVTGMLWHDGNMWICSNEKPRNNDRVFEIYEPTDLDDYKRNMISENIEELGQDKPVGYYGPRCHDSTIAGVILVMIGVTNLLSCWPELEHNQALHASVPVYILVGAMAIRVAALPRESSDDVRTWMSFAGVLSVIYGIYLGRTLNNFSGSI